MTMIDTQLFDQVPQLGVDRKINVTVCDQFGDRCCRLARYLRRLQLREEVLVVIAFDEGPVDLSKDVDEDCKPEAKSK